MKSEYENGFWRRFLRLSVDGWSSEFESVDRLLERLRGETKSTASRNVYCYNLWVACLWVTIGLRPPSKGNESQQTLNGSKADGKLSKSRNKWSKVAEELNFNVISPDELISLARENPEQTARLLRKLALERFENGSFRYANNFLASLNTFFKVNKVDLEIENFSVRGRGEQRRRQEYIPELKEAWRMAEVAGSLRDRLIILLLIYTGLRNSTLRALVYNERYSEPNYREYTIKKQLQRGERCIAIIVHPIMKTRVPEACKNNRIYVTFIPPMVTELLCLYIDELERKYGPLKDDQPIFHTENRRLSLTVRLMTPISGRELQYIVKSNAQRAGLEYWRYVYPHCLRKTFEIFLRNQPEDVKLDVKEREHLFGHKLSGVQEEYFPKKIEELREKYSRLNFEPLVRVEKEERVVDENELQSFLQQGWHFEATLPSGKIVVWRKSVIKQISEIGAKSHTQLILEKLEQQQPSSSEHVVSNRLMQQSTDQDKSHVQRAESSQKAEYTVEKLRITEEKDVKPTIPKGMSLDSFIKVQQKMPLIHGDDNVSKKDNQSGTNIISQVSTGRPVPKSKQLSILNYAQ
ncbi:MAG: site-specific integrase [Candidatus Bathyarchaeia archaeon]